MNKRFSQAIINRRAGGFIPVIPDIKCRSPKEGDLIQGRDPAQAALMLAKAGAPALSVVTEADEFGGSVELMNKIAASAGIPILRKDFIKKTEDLKKSKENGADAILLICAILSNSELEYLYDYALTIGLEPLVETHTLEEMLFASKIGAQLIGINNRDILQLEKDEGDVSSTEFLAKYKPYDSILISESSIKSAADANAAILAGADAVLVGTAIWQSADIQNFFQELSLFEK